MAWFVTYCMVGALIALITFFVHQTKGAQEEMTSLEADMVDSSWLGIFVGLMLTWPLLIAMGLVEYSNRNDD